MPIVLCRIDDRLIHGQVVEGWLRIIDVDNIIVVSDQVAKDKMQQTLLSLAVPRNINVYSFSVDDASVKVREASLESKRLLLLFSNPQDVLRFVKNGVKISSVNVGGMHYVTGKKQVLRTLSVDEKDIAALTEIHNLKIELEGRVLPDDDRIDIFKAIEEGKNAK